MAAQTRCRMGNLGSTCLAMGISWVFSSTWTWKTRFLTVMRTGRAIPYTGGFPLR